MTPLAPPGEYVETLQEHAKKMESEKTPEKSAFWHDLERWMYEPQKIIPRPGELEMIAIIVQVPMKRAFDDGVIYGATNIFWTEGNDVY